MFIDYAKIFIKSGKGGDGHISFRRELYVPNGGPNGGDGGRGGNIIIHIDYNMNTLLQYKHKFKFIAQNGEDGGNNRCHGKDGEDLILNVPNGTIIRETNSNKIIVDMTNKSDFVILKGGKGGIGNMHFATSKMQAPRYAKPGMPSQELNITLELKLLADVSLVGFPNVGKSSFISLVSNAKPEINNYHFTTLNPHLGVVNVYDKEFVIVDIPGLIEGASSGNGLGDKFLKHIERTKILLHIVDISEFEGRDSLDDLNIIFNELEKYNINLKNKYHIIALNKIDLIDENVLTERIIKIKKQYNNIEIFPMSVSTNKGIKELIIKLSNIVNELKNNDTIYDTEIDLSEIFDNKESDVIINKLNSDYYEVKGYKIDKMLGYTNIDTEKGLDFIQKFMKDNNILSQLKDKGLKDGDTISLSGYEFEYYD